VHEYEPEALQRRVEAVLSANDHAQGRLDVLERHAAEFAWLGSADQVRGDIKQHGLPLGVLARRIFGAPALVDIKGPALVFV
jgi:hypothetical protein